MTGTLYLVATPIGNIEDITLRALKILESADIIVAEKTIKTKNLLKHYDIKTTARLLCFQDYNQEKQTLQIIKELKTGKNIAFVSGAGTPLINDPGFYLVREVIKSNITITTIPGPTAVIGGLIISGFPTDRFVFEGFIGRKSGKRKKRLEQLVDEQRTIVTFEAPHRLIGFLKDCLEILGDKEITIIRELTKKFETIKRGQISELIEYFSNTTPQGEFIVVIKGKDEKKEI